MRFIFVLLFSLSFLSFSVVFAEDIAFPSREEVIKASAPCKNGGTNISIAPEKYVCPVGESSDKSDAALTDEKKECSVQIALSFSAIDESVKKWTKQIQSSREKDVNMWFQEINKKAEYYADQYARVCTIPKLTQGDADIAYGCAKISDTFPETACKDIADRKITALKNMGYILTSKGIAKSFQNDKDAYIDKQKGVYSGMLDKWSLYKRVASTAVSKFTAYIKQAVK